MCHSSIGPTVVEEEGQTPTTWARLEPGYPVLFDSSRAHAVMGSTPTLLLVLYTARRQRFQPAMLTWEGRTPDQMLKLQTVMVDEAQAQVPQMHVSLVTDQSRAVVLVNWATWPEFAKTVSEGVLVALLPGDRRFDDAEPEASKVSKQEVVLLDQQTGKRFPRLVTVVLLGKGLAQLEETILPDSRLSSPTPVEILVEVDSRMSAAVDPKAALTSFTAELLGTAHSSKLVFSQVQRQEDQHLLAVARMKTSTADLPKTLAASGKEGVFTRVAFHSKDLAPDMILVWAPKDLAVPHLGQFLLNVQLMTRSSLGLCRSKYALGVRTTIDLACEVRKQLRTQPIMQLPWTAKLRPTLTFLLRGVPAELDATELSTALNKLLSWPAVPQRRLKTGAKSRSTWIVTAEVAPTAQQMRTHSALITIEASAEPERDRKRKAPKGKGKGQPSNAYTSQDDWWDHHGDDKENWDPAPMQSTPHASQQDPWARYTHQAGPKWRDTISCPPAGNTEQIDKLQKQVADIEHAHAAQLERTSKVETRLTSVESGVTELRSSIQVNFDRLFDKFEAMNSGSPSRKNARSTLSPASRGGTADGAVGRAIKYGAIDVEDLVVSPELFSLAFVNGATFKSHLDRLLELNVDGVGLAETNHTPADMHDHKYIPRGSEWERVNLQWSPAVRAPKDQRTPGRASSGVLFASPLVWEEETLLGTPLERFSKQGRVCVTKVHYTASRAVWIATIYAHVTKDHEHRVQNQLMLSAIFEHFAPRSEEDIIIIIGDFNVELEGDLASIQAIQTDRSLCGHLWGDHRAHLTRADLCVCLSYQLHR
eukprot:2317962-Amphidinium_carterae.2